MTNQRVVIAIPIYRMPLPNEEVSLVQLRRHLSEHPVRVVAPQHLSIEHPVLRTIPVERFHDDYFRDISGYNRLMMSREFYRRFAAYEFILIYQLDCLVFSNQLTRWCDEDYDYIGAPWFKGHLDDTAEGLWAVGNGGLSLRRTAKFLEVLTSRKLEEPPMVRAQRTDLFRSKPKLRYSFCLLKSLFHALGYKNTVRHFIRTFPQHEDLFWSFHAHKFVDDFRVPSPRAALGFAFEHAPRYCYSLNDNRVPFGCHAWEKTDPKFWAEILHEVGGN